MPLHADPLPALSRGRVHAPIRTGVRVVDLFTPLCRGQRVGVFAGSGVGKSSLFLRCSLGRPWILDSVVIALVGERGREVREFLDDTLGEDRASAVAVVSTGDESPNDASSRPENSNGDSLVVPCVLGGFGVADCRFGDAICVCCIRRGVGGRGASRRARLRAERIQPSAAPA